MELKLTFLGRTAGSAAPAAARWRVRVELPCGVRPLGLAVGLWGENDAPLGPTVVAPHGFEGPWEPELAGPSPLPPGTMVRCVADIEASAPLVYWLGLDARRGLHAFMHADARLPVVSTATGRAVGSDERARLAVAFPWLQGRGVASEPDAEADEPGARADDPSLPPDLKDLLRDEFGVDLDDEGP